MTFLHLTISYYSLLNRNRRHLEKSQNVKEFFASLDPVSRTAGLGLKYQKRYQYPIFVTLPIALPTDGERYSTGEPASLKPLILNFVS